MNALEFLRQALPPNGWYVGLALKKIDGQDRRIQTSWATLEQLHRFLTYWDNCGYHVYYAVAAFKQQTLLVNGKPTNRTHENVAGLGDLPLDIDTRKTHANAKYENADEASEAVVAFCAAANMPAPSIWVSSGGGLHVHWLLAEILELVEWEIYARGLKQLAADHGLDIDKPKAADGSAVLRAPGFRNFKFDPPEYVRAEGPGTQYPLERFAHLREIGLARPQRSAPTSSPRLADSPIAAALIGTVYDDPSDPERTARACAQLASFKAGPGKFSEPFIRDAAGLCKNSCADGLAIFLTWLDPAFHDEARGKFERWNTGPPLCTTLQDHSSFPELCKSCPEYGKISSPIELGRRAEKQIERLAAARAAPIQVPHQPEGISQAVEGDLNGFPILKLPWDLRNGKMVHVSEDKKGVEQLDVFSDHPIYIDGENASEALGEKSIFYTIKHKPPNEPWCTVSVPAGDLQGSATKGLATLASSGAHLRDNGMFLEYMRDHLDEWKSKHRYGIRYEQCGLKPGGKAFLSGSNLYTCDGFQQVAVSDEVAIREKLGLGPRPGGDMREFLSTLNKLFVPDNFCAWMNLALSYGSALQPLLNQYQGSLVVVNMSPQSQTGKSVILYAACAIWGLWDALSLKDQDTAPSIGLILAALGNLPVFVDEIQHFARDPLYGAQRLRAFLDLFTSGIDKHRALPYGMGIRVQTNRWLNILLSSSNTSIIDLIQALGKAGSSDEAATNRYLEFLVKLREFDQVLGPELERHLWLNSGWAGHEFLRFTMREDIQKHLKQLIPQTTELLWKRVDYVKEQRFRVNGLALAHCAAQMLHERGMPLTCRLDELDDWGIEQIRARAPLTDAVARTADNALQALDKFLRHNANNTLRLLDAYKKNLTQTPIGGRFTGRLVIRAEQKSGRVYINLHEFKTYCVENGYFWNDVQRNLIEQKILIGARKMTLGAGTEYSSVQTMCLEFDANHPVFSEVLQPVSD